METIISNTKGEDFLDSYLWSLERHGKRTLYDAYKNPSSEKRTAYTNCLLKAVDDNGCTWTVVRSSSQFFSFAYLFKRNGVLFLKYITHVHDYVYEVPYHMAKEIEQHGTVEYAKIYCRY